MLNFPKRFLVVSYRRCEQLWVSPVPLSEFEGIENAWSAWLANGRDQIVQVRELTGATLYIPASCIASIHEHTDASIAGDVDFEASLRAIDKERKRAILGHEYDPGQD